MSQLQPRIGPLQIGIILLTVATAFVHIYLAILFLGGPDALLGILFAANGLGYLGLLGLLYLPVPALAPFHNWVRWALIIFTVVTIIAWLIMGSRDLLGYLTKAIEIVLIVLLFLEGRQTHPADTSIG